MKKFYKNKEENLHSHKRILEISFHQGWKFKVGSFYGWQVFDLIAWFSKFPTFRTIEPVFQPSSGNTKISDFKLFERQMLTRYEKLISIFYWQKKVEKLEKYSITRFLWLWAIERWWKAFKNFHFSFW